MLYRDITEGATLVHEADREARAALFKALDFYMSELWQPFNPNGYNEDDPDERHNNYQRFYDHYYNDLENRKSLMTQICIVAGSTLTRVIHDDLKKRFGSFIMFDSSKISIVTMRVEISVQPTEGEDARKGGFFSPGLSWSWIKVHVDPDQLIMAAMAAVQSIAFGEAEDRYALVNNISPTFAHEYSHLLQYLGAKDYRAFKSGITTLGGGKGGIRQGDRTMTGWWRYMGSNAEIDSFASSAASEMIASKEQHRWRSDGLDNSDIDDTLQDTASGYAGSDGYEIYIRKYQEALAGEYEDIGLSKAEAVKVWNRFLKTLYAKLNAYKKTHHGKESSGYLTGKADPQWIEWAKKGMPFCAARLADTIAFECADQSYKSYDGEWRIEPNAPFQKALSFLEAYFFKDNYNFEQTMKIVHALKALVIRRLPHYQKQHAA